MTTARLRVTFAGPHVSYQDGGRPGLLRFGVPESGPMDGLAHAAANLAVGNPADATAIEISPAGLTIECVDGGVTFAVAGGGFVVDHAGTRSGGWEVRTLRPGETLQVQRGHWGSWTYLALAGRIEAAEWLGHTATHTTSGFGGGLLESGGEIVIRDSRISPERERRFPCPVLARAQSTARVVLGPQLHRVQPEAVAALLTGAHTLSDSYDRMGVRLRGPALAIADALSIPSEPIVAGSIQVAGDGVATLLLRDHQTTGGYPKIATVLAADLDRVVQLRPRDRITFQAVGADRAIQIARLHAQRCAAYLGTISTPN
ncbi:biotin-dependent carboxyltransferase family protein [uncultured Paracoccus sp.]|uniref:5-oxoprolinase subunit C family protein n=1 Tax=uncultured Paracoccus sp. TaxID=189685 RepID=UPI00262B2E31|nr:biotin-dependent carboxyltransferase family protein [uncultured Paracoccus sp.]